MADLRDHFKQSFTESEFSARYLKYLAGILERLPAEGIGRIIQTLTIARDGGKTIYVLGNGGSAAIASHFANDLGLGTRGDGIRPFRVISLTDNIAVMTALANDQGYAQIFRQQLEGRLEEGDVVVAFSVSGESSNVLDAVEYANSVGAVSIGCTGFSGGRLLKMSRISFHIPTSVGEYGPVEDVFGIFGHVIYSYLRFQNRPDLCDRS